MPHPTRSRSASFATNSNKIEQLGSYGGGNHFGECEVVRVDDGLPARQTAQSFGIKDGHVAFLSHCGSRGFGHHLAMVQFKSLLAFFEKWNIPLPGNDRELVYAPLGTPEGDAYLNDMSLGANYATLNHLLINALVLEAFQQVIPGVKGDLVYFISHNIAREEIVPGVGKQWVMRKGATRAFPAGHPELAGTRYADTGHPILLPGSPTAGSRVMVADILFNGRNYPLDESPAAYKDFPEVIRSVETAGLARSVARLEAKFVLKDSDAADD